MALTCAHVVEAALRRPRLDEAPGDTFPVDFPAVSPTAAAVTARVADGGWFRNPPAGDLAVLRLEGLPPPEAAPAPLGGGSSGEGVEGIEGVPVLVFGHPAEVPDGMWARARTVGTGGPHPGWLQLDGDSGYGARIERGFSGAGVWDGRRRQVVGVVASVLESTGSAATRVAWMIPLGVLAGTAFGPLIGGGTPAPRAEPDPWALVDALLAAGVATPDGGRGLLSLLPDRIAWSVPRDDRPRLQLFQLVLRCGDFTDGPGALVRAVRQLEGDTITVRHFVEQARLLWPNQLDGHG
jgi:hypothetical protein